MFVCFSGILLQDAIPDVRLKCILIDCVILRYVWWSLFLEYFPWDYSHRHFDAWEITRNPRALPCNSIYGYIPQNGSLKCFSQFSIPETQYQIVASFKTMQWLIISYWEYAQSESLLESALDPNCLYLKAFGMRFDTGPCMWLTEKARSFDDRYEFIRYWWTLSSISVQSQNEWYKSLDSALWLLISFKLSKLIWPRRLIKPLVITQELTRFCHEKWITWTQSNYTV